MSKNEIADIEPSYGNPLGRSQTDAYNGTTWRELRMDKYTRSLISIDFAHHEIHDGDTFMYHDVIDSLASGSSQDYLFTTPNTTKWIHIGHSSEFSAAGTVEIFEGTDRVGITPQTLFNRDRNSAAVSTLTLAKGTSAGTTDGTRIVYWKGGTNQAKTYSLHGTSEEKILKQNTKYIIRLTSRAEANVISFSSTWYEHENMEV
jgi:hypothetical protein